MQNVPNVEVRIFFGIINNKMDVQEKINEIESRDELSGVYLLYALLDYAENLTGRGYVSDDYTKTIEFDIGEIKIVIDEYYGNLTIEIDGCEYDISNEEFLIGELIEEIKERILEFDKKINKTKEKISEEIFNKPIDNELLKSIEGDVEDEN